MSLWAEARRHLANDETKIVCVAVRIGSRILTGQRRDNKKWTFPGGHLDIGETLSEGAARELKEEAGIDIDPSALELIEVKRYEDGRNGQPFVVFAFETQLEGNQIPLTHMDPDQEILQWKLVEMSQETPELKPDARHAKEDLILKHFKCWPEPMDPSRMSMTQRRMAYSSDEGTEGYAPVVAEVKNEPEEQVIDNVIRNDL